MKAIVLAAGRGERMGELTADRPKPLLSLGDETLIERQLRLLRRAGVRDIVINLSHHGELIADMLGDGRRYGVSIAWSDEGEPALETAGGIVHALDLLGDEPFLVVNSDVVTDFDYARLVAAADTQLGELHGMIVLVGNPVHHRIGDFGINADGLATDSGPRLTYSGIALLRPALFAGLAPGRRPLRPVLEQAIAAKRLGALRYDGVWIDVGTPERLEAARELPLAT